MNPPNSKGGVFVQRVVIAETKNAMHVQWAYESPISRHNDGLVKDVWISAIARAECGDDCFNSAVKQENCINSYGYILSTTNYAGIEFLK